MPNKRKLSDLTFFKEFPDEAIRDLIAKGSTLEFRNKETILTHTDQSDDVYFMLSGRARVIIHAENGSEIGFRYVNPDEIFGEFSAIDKYPRSASVETLAPTILFRISSTIFWTLIDDEPAFRNALLLHLVTLLRFMTTGFYEYRAFKVSCRIHREILRLSGLGQRRPDGVFITPDPNRQEMAARLNTSREEISREISSLAKVGLITRQKSGLLITDIEQLRKMANFPDK